MREPQRWFDASIGIDLARADYLLSDPGVLKASRLMSNPIKD